MKILGRILAIIGGLVVLIVLVALIAAAVRGKGSVPSRAVLELNLETGLVEDIPEDALAKAMSSGKLTVRDVVEALERGANDKRVAGVVGRFGAGGIGIAQSQEIRDAIARFRAKNKFTIAFAESFGGDYGPGTGPYYLASAFEQVYLQPSGDVQLSGILMESPFVKGTLDKLGMKFRGDHRYEYKNALNMLTETKFTAPHREAMERMKDSWFGQIVRGIAESRHLSEDQVKALVDRAPLLGKEAEEAKLVDGLKYRDEVYDMAKKKAGEGAEMIYAGRYLERAGRPHEKGKVIALVFGVGTVTRGKSGYDPMMGSMKMGSDTVAGAIRAAAEDKNVKAILFRVDSPGGSYIASDAIWREVVRARQKGKPVIVSMGDLAGSGGYFVAMPADKIVAQPGTITASIGVLSGKMLTSGFWNKIGLSWDEVHSGNNALFYTGTHDYSPAEWQRFQAWLDRVYVDFTDKVAEGRKLPKEKVLQVAKGRIWSGEDAKAHGLVDELGGYDTALRLAKKAGGIPETEEVNLKVFPAKKTFLQQLLAGKPDNSEKEATASVLVRTLELIQPVARKLGALSGMRERELMIPGFAY
ncbi:MAG: signal peptide peptidase SppA [Terriglobales bacterium]